MICTFNISTLLGMANVFAVQIRLESFRLILAMENIYALQVVYRYLRLGTSFNISLWHIGLTCINIVM